MSVTGLLGAIADVGRDPATGGYRRFAFGRADGELADWFADQAAARGLDLTTDRCGNQWAWWGDPDADGPGIVTGSHLDSVPDGGPLDGPLGVASALVAVDLLRARGFRPGRPLGVVRFVDEEGARFGLACSGSRLLTGAAEPARVLALRDVDGIGYGEAMAAAGLDPERAGRDDETLHRVAAFVELHVEQGRGLVDLGSPVGVASLIRPHGRWRVELTGRADHAGTTLLADRADPMLDLARLITLARDAAVRHGALATVGRVEVRPNAVNAVPSRVLAWLDVRADTPELVRAVLADLVDAGFGCHRESWTDATPLDADLTAEVAAAVRDGGALGAGAPGTVPVLATGAGHDAGVLAQAGIASAMLFVRNPTGVSHAPAEYAEPADCEAGAVALAAVLDRLAGPGRERVRS